MRSALIAALWLTLASAAAEPLAEARANQLDDLARHYRNALRGEEVLELTAGGTPFPALYLEQRTGEPLGGVVLVHDAGQHPDWPFRLQQARSYLPEVGWSTLSIALPHAPDAATVQARITAALGQLDQEAPANLVLLGFGEGAYWASRFLVEQPPAPGDTGYALLLVDATPDRADLPELIGQLGVPVLDLVFNHDGWAERQARERRAEAARNGLDYLQIRDAPDGTFLGEPNPSRTTRRLWGWLRSYVAGNDENAPQD